MFLMWLGEQMTARGVGNGTSLIIFAGIIAEMPRTAVSVLQLVASRRHQLLRHRCDHRRSGSRRWCFIVFIERSQRRLVVQYPKRQQGNRMFMGESSFLPLKLNTVRRHPADLRLVAVDAADHDGAIRWPIATCRRGCSLAAGWSASSLGYGQPLLLALYAARIIFFCFFYTSIVFNPEETADNLRKYGGFLPGIRPGEAHGGVSRLCADAPDRDRRRLHHRWSVCCRKS